MRNPDLSARSDNYSPNFSNLTNFRKAVITPSEDVNRNLLERPFHDREVATNAEALMVEWLAPAKRATAI